MSDILLSVGLQTGAAETSQIQADLQKIISQIDKNPPRIRVGLQVDQTAINHFRSQLTQIVNSVALAKGAPITVSISGIGEITTQAGKAKAALDGVATAGRQAAESINKMGSQPVVKKLTEGTDEYNRALGQTESLLAQVKRRQAEWTAAKTGKSSGAYNSLVTYRAELETLLSKLRSGGMTAKEFASAFSTVQAKIKAAEGAIRSAGENTKTLGDRLKGLASKFSTWFSVSQVIMLAVRSVRQMVTAVRDVDKAMTELKKVTNETSGAYNQFLENASARAKRIGASLSDVINASADFARLGYNINDASSMADAALIYKNIGDGIEDVTTASESIISTMQAFGIEASNVMSIVDKFNEVGNNFAISSAGIGEAMQRSAAAMASANNTIEETIALITAANTIVQNPESVGTTLKTVSMYLRAAKTEAEEAGESTDGMADSVSELRDEILQLTGQRVDIQLDEDTFKSTYQILKELSVVWNDLTDVSQANILELVGGKRNANVVSALLENFTVAEKALETAAHSAGSAISENEKQLESIEGKIAKFKATFQSFSQNLIGSNTVKAFVDLGTAIITVLDKLQQLHLLFPTIIASFVALKSVGAAKSLTAITNTIVANKAATEGLSIAVSQLTAKQQLRMAADIKAAVASGALSDEQGRQILTTLGLASADGTLIAANKGLAASFKSLMASIPVWGWIALAITVVIEAVTALTEAVAKNKQAMIEDANSIIDAYENANSTYQSNISSLEGLRARFEQLSQGVDVNGECVSLTAEEYEEYLSLVQQICNISPSVVQGYDNEGRAIVNYTNLLNDAIAAQNKYIDNERNMYLGKGNEIFEGKSEEYRQAQADLAEAASNFGGLFNPTGFIGTLFDMDRADAIHKAYSDVFKKLGIDAAGAFNINPVYDELFKVYEKHDQIIAMLGEAGVYTQTEINAISNSIYGLAGAYTSLNAIEGEQVDYLMEWVKDKDWYNSIPIGALDEMRNGFVGVNNPLLSFNDNLSAAEQYGKAFAEAMADDAVIGIMDMSKGLADGSISLEDYNAAVASLQDSWTGNADVLPMIIAFLFSLTNGYSSVGSAAADAAGEIKAITDELSTNFSTLKAEADAVNSAISEQTTNGSISLETYDALIAASSDYASCIEYENGYMQLNAQKARELIDAKTELQILELEQAKIDEAANYRRIADALENATNSDEEYVAALQSELSVSEQLITKYRIMQSELAETLSAYNKWKEAQNDPESGDMYDDTLTALKQIQEGLESGKVGTAKYEASVELLVPEANRSDVSAYVESLKRYISEDITGVSNFISDSITAGLMVDDGSGNISILSDATVKDFCDKLQITPSMAQAIFGELEEYGWEFDWTAEDFIDAVDPVEVPTEVDLTALEALQNQLADYRSQLAALESNPLALQADITAIEEKIAITEQAIVDAGGVVPVDTTEAEGKLQAVQEDLDTIAEKADMVATKVIGDLGAGASSLALQDVINKLTEIDNKKIANKSYTVTQYVETVESGQSSANGTDYADGGRTLVGELGPELVVSDDRYYVVGSNGAEFVNLKRGDMVFNHIDTQKILNGKSGVRGQALRYGNVSIEQATLNGGGTIRIDAEISIDGGGQDIRPETQKPSNSNNNGGGKDSSETDEESWFEKQLKEHQHLVEMDKESQQDYLEWLDDAYKKAYEEGIIDLDDFYKYEEEVYKGRQDLFKDHLNDIDHEISMLEAGVGNSDEIVALSLQAIQDIEAELAAARAAGLDENGDYIQWLEQQWINYNETVVNLREEAESNSKSSIDNLVEYRIKMLKQEIEDEKDALDKKLDDLKDFYDKQRDMLQDQYDEEKYLEEQKEKRKSVTDIRAELAMLDSDNSAWAQKRKLELQAELSDAEKELSSFEKDHALDMTLDMLDEQQAAQESQIQAQIDALDEKLNDPHALFNQALADITNNTEALYKEFIEYNRKHGTGNDQDIADMWEEAYIADLEYQDTHNGEHPDGIEIGNYTGYVRPDNPTPPDPEEPSPPDDKPTEEPTESEPEPPELTDAIKKKVAAAIWNGGYGWGNGSTRTNRLTEVFGAGNGIQDLVNKGVGRSGVSLTSEYTYANMRKKFKGYASGTDNATPGWHKLFEGDLDEYVFTSSDGNRYRMFSGLGDKVLNGDATDFLYDFANSGGAILTKMLSNLFGLNNFGNISKPIQAIEIHAGDIVVQGSATERTVSEIRRAQRENIDFVIKEFNKLNK